MPTPPKVGHVDVAAYVLGILDEPDDAAFTRHFNRCAQCRAEYRELSDLPMLLDQLKSAPVKHKQPRLPAAPGNRVLGGAIDQVNAARKSRRRTLWLAAAAALVLLITVPVVILNIGGSGGGGQQVAAPTVTVSVKPSEPSTTETGTDVVAAARTVSKTDPKTGIGVSIGIDPQPWGTRVYLELRGVKGPMQCNLLAVTAADDQQVAITWQVPASGFGVDGSPEPLRIQGGTGISAEDIDLFSIRRDDGTVLLDVPT